MNKSVMSKSLKFNKEIKIEAQLDIDTIPQFYFAEGNIDPSR